MTGRLLLLMLVILVMQACEKERELEIRENGILKARWYYEKDTLNGRKELYLWPNASKSEIFNYKDGKLHGEYFALFENGQVARKGNYMQGQRVGPYYRYFKDQAGKIQSESYYIFANGVQYLFYTKHYNNEGKMIRYDGNIWISPTTNKDSLELEFVGRDRYDSMKIIAGQLTSDFKIEDRSQVDTFYFEENRLKLSFDKMKGHEGNYIRGIFKAYKSEWSGDSVQIREHTDFIEQNVDLLRSSRLEQRPVLQDSDLHRSI